MSTAKDRYRRETARTCTRCGGLGHTNHGSPTDIIFILGPKAPKCERCGGSGIEPLPIVSAAVLPPRGQA